MKSKGQGILFFMVFMMLLSLSVPVIQGQGSVTLLFYNTENFFDPFDDPLTLDDEFTPSGEMHWTFARFQQKAYHLYKLFMAVGEHLNGWDPPAMIALAEIENGYVLHYLLEETPFRKFDYGVVHYDSPDRRGIDVAFLYERERVEVLGSCPLPVHFTGDTLATTRDILYVLVHTNVGDTLALFINHWPSRRGGYLASESHREAAAAVLAAVMDTLKYGSGRGRVIVAGDLNDEPSDAAVAYLTGGTDRRWHLVNLMQPLLKENMGTLFYEGRWWMFDQFLVSRSLAGRCEAKILKFPFLFEHKQVDIPWRTYAGPHYLGGFSDHLPVVLTVRSAPGER